MSDHGIARRRVRLRSDSRKDLLGRGQASQLGPAGDRAPERSALGRDPPRGRHRGARRSRRRSPAGSPGARCCPRRRAARPRALASCSSRSTPCAPDALGCLRPRAARATPWIDRLARRGRALRDGPRAQRRDAALAREHALRPATPSSTACATTAASAFPTDTPTLATILLEPRGWRTGAFVSAFVLDSRFGLDGGFDVYDDRVAGGERSRAFAMPERPGPATVRRGPALARAGARARVLRLRPPLRAALPLRAARAASPRASRASPTTARWRRPTRRSGRCSSRSSRAGAGEPHARRPDLRPRRVARRARRGDARHLRLRGDAARAARPLRARRSSARGS